MPRLFSLLHALRRRLWRLTRRETQGVKVMLFDEAGALLLVRHSYGRTDLWMLPGGGIHRGEAPAIAAAREVLEELGCGVSDLAPVSVHLARAEGRRDTVHLFGGRAAGPIVPDGIEIAEARFFALDDLPENASPATRRRIEEHRGLRPTGPDW